METGRESLNQRDRHSRTAEKETDRRTRAYRDKKPTVSLIEIWRERESEEGGRHGK